MNIIKTLRKEVEAGRDFVKVDGKTINREELAVILRKSFAKSIANGIISGDVSFDAFMESEIQKLPRVTDILFAVEDWLGIPHEVEETETGAALSDTEPGNLVETVDM